MKNHATDAPNRAACPELRETLCLAMSIVIGAVHGRAEADELFSNAVLRRIGTIATKSVSLSRAIVWGQPFAVENGNAIPVVNVRGNMSSYLTKN